MPDRGVFLAAFLTLVLVVAGAFAIPEFFIYELLTSMIFVVIAVMVFFGEDKFPYMLGIIAPILWFVFSLLTGGLIAALGATVRFLSGKPSTSFETPLHGFAFLAALVLLVLSSRAWRKQITEKFLGKTFATAAVVSLIWVVALAAWQYHQFSGVARPH
jgi:hypothetical protein